jgi:hypothetical protein
MRVVWEPAAIGFSIFAEGMQERLGGLAPQCKS